MKKETTANVPSTAPKRRHISHFDVASSDFFFCCSAVNFSAWMTASAFGSCVGYMDSMNCSICSFASAIVMKRLFHPYLSTGNADLEEIGIFGSVLLVDSLCILAKDVTHRL
jgi:hypothetical protein